MSTPPCRLTRVQSLFMKTCSKRFQIYEKRENQIKNVNEIETEKMDSSTGKIGY